MLESNTCNNCHVIVNETDLEHESETCASLFGDGLAADVSHANRHNECRNCLKPIPANERFCSSYCARQKYGLI